MSQFYLGVDLHLKRSYVILMDADGKMLDKRSLENSKMRDYLSEKVPPKTHAVLEATRNWPFMYDMLSEHVDRVDLAHPKELKAIASAAVKTDRIDAGVLAHLARLNYLPVAYAAPTEVRDLRLWTRHRAWLIRQRTQCKNRIHAVLASYNYVSPVSDLFGLSGRAYLEDIMAGGMRSAALRVIEDNMKLIDHLEQEIEALERDLELTPEQRDRVRLLRTVPGIGGVHAVTILAEIGDIQRFNSPKALCNWAGLTPRVRKSDRIARYGRISKQGSPYLRAAMVQAASVAVRVSPRWKIIYDRLALRCGKMAARVAVGRRLLTVVYCMLKREEPYCEDYQAQPR